MSHCLHLSVLPSHLFLFHLTAQLYLITSETYMAYCLSIDNSNTSHNPNIYWKNWENGGTDSVSCSIITNHFQMQFMLISRGSCSCTFQWYLNGHLIQLPPGMLRHQTTKKQWILHHFEAINKYFILGMYWNPVLAPVMPDSGSLYKSSSRSDRFLQDFYWI